VDCCGQDDGDGGDTSDDDEAMQIDPSSKSDKAPAAIIILDDDDDDVPVTQPSNTSNTLNTSNTNNTNNTISMTNIINPINTTNTSTSNTSNNQQQVQNNTPAPIYSQRPTVIRQSSTPGVPYMQHEQLIQSPPLSANTNVMIQSPPDTTIFEQVQTSNNVNNNISRSKRKKERKSRRGGTGVASQEKGNSSTKDDNNNYDDNNNVENYSGRLSWSFVTGINSSPQDYQTLLSQDIVSQNATQVASPISPNSVTNPNFSQHKQDEIEEGEWLTEDEQEEVVLDSNRCW